ncbi:MAG: 6,7-dimethyl-8-ribityllumazine synthase [Candidatus Calescibacterium sp.]|jgi:6,7-dimethyl-8-ribityllumazine synthase
MNEEKKKSKNETIIKIGIVVSRFNEFITSRLLDGAKRALEENGISYDVIYVPGSFEIPIAAKFIAKTQKYDSILVLGCIIKGETYHFDFVAKGVQEGILKVMLETEIPIIFGVLTVENINQAIDRAGGKYGNKGYEWGINAIYMAKLKRQINEEKHANED